MIGLGSPGEGGQAERRARTRRGVELGVQQRVDLVKEGENRAGETGQREEDRGGEAEIAMQQDEKATDHPASLPAVRQRGVDPPPGAVVAGAEGDRKSTRLNSSH